MTIFPNLNYWIIGDDISEFIHPGWFLRVVYLVLVLVTEALATTPRNMFHIFRVDGVGGNIYFCLSSVSIHQSSTLFVCNWKRGIIKQNTCINHHPCLLWHRKIFAKQTSVA